MSLLITYGNVAVVLLFSEVVVINTPLAFSAILSFDIILVSISVTINISRNANVIVAIHTTIHDANLITQLHV